MSTSTSTSQSLLSLECDFLKTFISNEDILQYYRQIRLRYIQLPKTLTSYKFQILNQFTFEKRLIILSTCTLVTALGSLRGYYGHQIMNNLTQTIRNIGIVYIFGGIILTPEIYNPFIKISQL